jgi:saccharopine dehydrogenase-like NADP-dependent oxidoreductase
MRSCPGVRQNCFLRVGALPQFPSNTLKYNLTWSTDGLINEYCNLCESVRDGRVEETQPLEGLEQFNLDGVRYEAFNTSGGLGTLCDTMHGQVQNLNYKTVRYVGHRDLMAFLINGLGLGKRRDVLKDVLEHAVPITDQDVVIVFCTVSGWIDGKLVQKSDARKIYQGRLNGVTHSAIQLTTAAGICTMLDLHREGALPSSGFVRQEAVSLERFLSNRFGRTYAPKSSPLATLNAANDSYPPPELEIKEVS